jgi:hypothetical protein
MIKENPCPGQANFILTGRNFILFNDMEMTNVKILMKFKDCLKFVFNTFYHVRLSVVEAF